MQEKKPFKASLYLAIAKRLAEDIKNIPGPRLPSQRSLYTRYGVSQATLKAAIRVLEKQGLVDTKAPGRIRICGRQEIAPSERISAEESVCRHIRLGIMESRYRSGDALPKMAALAAERAVSTHSVLRAYHRLGRERLLHRRGKSWVVGLPEVRVVDGGWKSLLVLTHYASSWNGLGSASRTRGFCMAFSREAQLHKTLMITACSAPSKANMPLFLGGTEAVMRKIDELGTGFMGMLVAARRKEVPDLELFAAHLHKRRRPLVWFDGNDEGRTGMSIPLSTSRITPWFTRCHFDEKAAIVLALKRLTEAGHRTIGFLYHGRDWWIRNRLEMLREAAAGLEEGSGGPVRIVAYTHDTLLHSLRDAKQAYAQLERILRENIPVASGVLKRILRKMAQGGRRSADHVLLERLAGEIVEGKGPVSGFTKEEVDLLAYASLFRPYLGNPEITALIAPNDSKTFLYYRHLAQLGITIPDKYSLISFDNYVPDQPNYPITTVDFGFDTLGDGAFHAIMGDLPVNRNRQGDIAARPRLVERGSIGSPPRGVA